jgi:hypothetical protein
MMRALPSMARIDSASIQLFASARALAIDTILSGLTPVASSPVWILPAIDMVSKKPSSLRSSVT